LQGWSDLEAEVAPVVVRQGIGSAAEHDLTAMQLAFLDVRRRGEADLDLGVGGDLYLLLVLLQAVEIELDRPGRGCRSLGADPGADLDRLALGRHARRRLRRIDRNIVD